MLFLLEGRVWSRAITPLSLLGLRRGLVIGRRRGNLSGTPPGYKSPCSEPITWTVQFPDVVSRVAELETLAVSTLAQPAPPSAPPAVTGGSAFAQALARLSPAPRRPPAAASRRSSPLAESQVGQAEQPPGSNDGPRSRSTGAPSPARSPGEPWCAYFASWAAAQAGTPLGDAGAGPRFGRGITDWAERTGRYLPAGSTPAAGRPDSLRQRSRRRRRVRQPRRLADDDRGQLRPGREPGPPHALRGHRLRAHELRRRTPGWASVRE